ncbi:MAG: D-aminoacyl-tRNA deacylase [Candidatus Omnitrophota bacterium]
MRVVLQRVREAAVTVRGQYINSIGKGLLLLVGIGRGDSVKTVRAMAQKISKLRVFEDKDGKMNLDVIQAVGKILSVPQFTLLGDTSKGNRPGFDGAAFPEDAVVLWEEFNKSLKGKKILVKEGEFGAHMEIRLVNDGPVTFILDSKREE